MRVVLGNGCTEDALVRAAERLAEKRGISIEKALAVLLKRGSRRRGRGR